MLFFLQMASWCLSSDLGSMVNNPQLSDVQLQVDAGQVFFAHSFMLYARCPLLVEMVNDLTRVFKPLRDKTTKLAAENITASWFLSTHCFVPPPPHAGS